MDIPTTQNPSSLKSYIPIIILVAILVPSLTWNVLSSNSKIKLPLSRQSDNSPDSKFFDTQLAIVEGKVTKQEGNKAWVENKSGTIQEFTLAQNFFSNKTPPGLATDTQNPPKIDLNKNATINFQIVNGKHQITSIYFPIELPSQPIQTNSTASGAIIHLSKPLEGTSSTIITNPE